MMRAHFLQLLDAETWANRRTLASLDTVPESHRHSPAFLRAACLLPHIALARMVWLFRLTDTPYENPPDWFPSWEREYLSAQFEALDARWREYLASLTETELSRPVGYSSSEGARYTNQVHEILTHVFQHGAYHRGQIARLVHECAGQRGATDFILFARRA